MRAMALADLQAIADRLKSLHERLEQETGRRWLQTDISGGAKIRHRTFQTWIGAKNENTGGKGYEKLAAWYRHKLQDDTITYNWLVWGQQEPPEEEKITPIAVAPGPDPDHDQLDRIEEKLDELLRRLSPPSEGGDDAGERGGPADPPDDPSLPPSSLDDLEPPSEEEGRRQTG